MRKTFFLIAVGVMLLSKSCRGLVHEQEVIGNFYLVAVDSETEMSLSYKLNDGGYIGIVPAIVYSAGHDSKYVYAKQHPEGPKGKTNYYIVPLKITNSYKVQNEIIGPLDEGQFDKKLDDLRVTKKDGLFQITLENL